MSDDMLDSDGGEEAVGAIVKPRPPKPSPLAAAASISLDVPLRSIPYAQEWLGVWAIYEPHFNSLASMVRGMSVKDHLDARAAFGKERQKPTLMKGENGIAVIPLRGTLQKQEASFSESTSTVEARRLIREAAADPEIKGIMLLIDSPGGTVSGTEALATEVAKATAKKPTYAFIEDLGASAAYWVASQAEKIFTNATGIVGSIGTFGIVYDYHVAAAAQGIEVLVIRAGEFKGAGVPGTKITASQIDDIQRRIDQLNDQFIAGVAIGRKMSTDQVKALATGQVHVGQAAVDLKLVDGVASAEDVIAQLVSASARKQKMDTPKAATLAELKAACPGSTAEWREKQMEAGASIEQASRAFISFQSDELAKRAAELEEITNARAEEDRAAAAKAKKPGNDPVVAKGGKTAASNAGGDPLADFDAAVADRMKTYSVDRRKAIAMVCKADPELHRAYMEANNTSRKAKDLIADRFGE
jgi:signal peptide peptidase SppA